VTYQFLLSEQEILRKTVTELTELYAKTFAEPEDKDNAQVMEILDDDAHIPVTKTAAPAAIAADEEEEEVVAKPARKTEKKSSAAFDEEEDEF
jgi:hypothetical protein